ncbi:MAG: PAS domain S-box protein, partial [Longimicrobiaceae bacterium]
MDEITAWPAEGGEPGALIRARDWSATPLGPVEGWPPALRAAVEIMLPAAARIAVYWGRDHVLLYNDPWRTLIGAKHPAALGRPAREVFPEIWDAIGPLLARVLAGGGPVEARDELLPLDRGGGLEDAWFDFSFNPIPSTDGRVGGVLNLALETTARVRAASAPHAGEPIVHPGGDVPDPLGGGSQGALDRLRQANAALARREAELRESEERHRLIVESARDYAIFTTDPHGRVESWSPGAETVFGWTAAEVLGRDAAILFVPEDQARGEPAKELETARRAGVAPDVRWHLRSDGSRVFIEGSTRALHHVGGEVRGFLKIGQDVTERRGAEGALRESQRRLAAALRTARMVAWEWDPVHDRTITSDTAADVFGLLPGETLDSSAAWLRLMHPLDAERHRALVRRAGERGEGWHAEVRIVRPRDGRVAWLEERATVTPDPETG